jgi:3-dehydroquinate synthetase
LTWLLIYDKINEENYVEADMEDKLYEKEENIKETEPSEEKKDKTIDKEEWSAVKKSHAEKKPETDEDKKDKKAEGDQIHFVLPKSIGEVEIVGLTVEEVCRMMK